MAHGTCENLSTGASFDHLFKGIQSKIICPDQLLNKNESMDESDFKNEISNRIIEMYAYTLTFYSWYILLMKPQPELHIKIKTISRKGERE